MASMARPAASTGRSPAVQRTGRALEQAPARSSRQGYGVVRRFPGSADPRAPVLPLLIDDERHQNQQAAVEARKKSSNDATIGTTATRRSHAHHSRTR